MIKKVSASQINRRRHIITLAGLAIASTFLTLLVVPVGYSQLMGRRGKKGR
jgi:multidrug efflux pump subunit AcrB